MATILDPKLNYSSLLSLSAVESSRVNVALVPQTGATYSSDNIKHIEVLFPPTSYLDSQCSYARFNVQLSAVCKTAGTVVDPLRVCLDNAPATAVFADATLQNSEGQVVTDIRNLAEVSLSRIREKGIDYQNSVAENMMGYSSAWEAILTHDDYVNSTLFSNMDASIGTTPTSSRFPGSLEIPTGVKTVGQTYQGQLVQLCIPLEYLSPLFSGGCHSNYIPLHLMASRSHALKLAMYMQNAAQAMVVCGETSQAPTDAALFNFRYDITNFEIVCEFVNVGAEQDAIVRNGIENSQVQILFRDYTSIQDNSWNTGNNTFNGVNSKFTISLDALNVQVRNNNHINNFGQESISGTRRYNINSLQCKVGTKYIPASALLLPSTTFNGSAWAEWAKASGTLTRKTGHANVALWHIPSCAGFEFALDFDKKELSDAVADQSYTLSGLDTRAGSSQVIISMVRTSSAEPLSVTAIFQTSNVLVLRQGLSAPIERP